MLQPIIPLLTLAAALLTIALIFSFKGKRWCPALAFCGMIAGNLSRYVTFETETLIFWGIAAALATAITLMLPAFVARSQKGVAHIAVGTLAGAAVGMVTETRAGIIGGAIIGAFLGAVIFARTPGGHAMAFPSAKFFNYLGAKGLPIVVTIAITALVVIQLITIQS